jgi:hypothetical protein
MSQAKTHWKVLHNPDYIGAYAFQPNEDKIVTIKSAQVEAVSGSGGKKEDCMIVRFTENVKPLICNVTNSKAIEKVSGSPYIEDWGGTKIQLYVTEVSAFGETVQAVRVRPKAPKITLPKLEQGSDKWNKAVQALADGTTTIQAIQKHYELSATVQKELAKAVQALTETGEINV